tara:strand:+ start:1463 stop:2863 length:1401 start_codon:yes stop_codon:yes gene_type:complete
MTKEFNNYNIEYFPSHIGDNKELLTLLNKTSEILCNWFSDTNNLSPIPPNNIFRNSLPEDSGCNTKVLLEEIRNLLYTSFTPSHPGSLAHLDPPPLAISIIGDLIASGLNNNLLAEELSPSISILERDICKWFAKKVGFTDISGGIAASGGTLNNLNALVTAKYNAGLISNNNAVLILSKDAHVSFKKCARILGLKDENIYFVNTDENGRMDFSAFDFLINSLLKSGKKIFAVVATFGTTITGALDPINEIGYKCKAENIWFHIDASIGGIFLITNKEFNNIPDFKISNANSITINPQKLIGIAKTSSLLLVSNINTLKNTFHTGLPYIDSLEDTVNRGELGVQGSRPAEIIKLWLGLKFLGLEGIENILNSYILKKSIFLDHLDKSKFELFSGPLHIVSFLPKNMNNEESNNWTLAVRKYLLDKNYMISRPLFKGKYFLRIVFGNFNTSDSHILELTNLLNNFTL